MIILMSSSDKVHESWNTSSYYLFLKENNKKIITIYRKLNHRIVTFFDELIEINAYNYTTTVVKL